MKRVVLSGNPNCGKTAIFNLLTGLNQQVSNLAGTTVEVNRGKAIVGTEKVEFIDLPGAYSIYPSGGDEKLAIDYLLKNQKQIDLILYVADKDQIYRNALFFSQLSLLNLPILLVINMYDKPEESNIEQIKEKLKIDVVAFSAKNPRKYPSLKSTLLNSLNNSKRCIYYANADFPDIKSIIEGKSDNVVKANHTLFLYKKNTEVFSASTAAEKRHEASKTYQIDRWVMHPVLGFVIFGLIMFGLFQLLFSFAEFPMNAIDLFFSRLNTFVANSLSDNSWFKELLVKGIIPGLGGVFIFVPQIVLLFLILGFLEDTGYISRMSILMDNSLKRVGLNGKSIIPIIAGFACAIPAIMSARTIKNTKERLITILVTPLIACSARLPVYTVLISLLFVPESNNMVNARGLLFFIMYFLGIVAAILVAFVFSKIIKTTSQDISVIELPAYRMPIVLNVFKNTWHKTVQFIKGAGVIIFIISIVLWVLTSNGPKKEMLAIDARYENQDMTDSLTIIKNSEMLKVSYAGQLGKVIEPVIAPLGYDWKIGIALISSFAAREVFIATISTIYALESDEETLIVERLRKAKRENGTAVYTKGTIISLLLFYAFALQCMSTIAVMKRETGAWKWPVIQFLYMGFLAYLTAFIAFQTFG